MLDVYINVYIRVSKGTSTETVSKGNPLKLVYCSSVCVDQRDKSKTQRTRRRKFGIKFLHQTCRPGSKLIPNSSARRGALPSRTHFFV